MLLDALYAGRSMQEMALLVLAGTGASFVTAILRHLVTKKKNIMWWGMQHRMTEPIMTKTMQMDYEQIGDERVRTLRARQDEYRKREKDVFERFLTQLEILLTSAVRMAAAIITIGPFFAKQFSKTAGTQETLFRIIAIAALFAVLYLNRRSVLEQGKRRLAIHNEHEDENRLNSYMMNEVVLSQKAGKDIRIFHQEPMMEHYGDQMNANWRRMTLQYAKNDVCHFGLQGMLSSCVGGIIYLYVAFCAYGGMITIGNVVRYAGAVQQFIQGMTDLFAGWSRLHHDRMQMDEYLEYMCLQNKMNQASRPVSLTDMENPEVEFVDVSFRYPGTEQYVLRDVNVKISARESTAFVGLNGSGKTTFIKKMIDEVFKGEKIVLIENEFGEVGIDGGFLKDAGIEITEMNSGCSCCSVVGDFGKNLHEVIDKYHPDRILIEPSGVGKLSDVMKSVIDIEKEEDVKLNGLVTVVNALKASKQMKAFGEFFNNQIEYATVVVLSRSQNATPEQLELCVKQIQTLNQKAAIITTAWDASKGEQILKVIE